MVDKRRFAWFRLLLLGIALCGSMTGKQAMVTGTTSAPMVTRRVVSYTIEDAPANLRLFGWINGRHAPMLDTIFLAIAFFGSGWFLLPVLLAVLAWRRDLLAPFIIGILIETLLVIILKEYFHQSRPLAVLGAGQVHALLPYTGHSFPSGDTAMAFALAGVLGYRARWMAASAWGLYALLIAYERIYLGVHFPLDVVTGALVGLLSAGMALAAVDRFRPHLVVLPARQTTDEEDLPRAA